MNPMKNIRIEKLTLNIGAGKEQAKLEKGVLLLKTITNKRIPSWGVRPGLPIGCKLTLRKQSAKELIKRLLKAKQNKLKESNFDNLGNVSFGIHEYIDIPGIEYDPKIGVLGLQVCITLERPGYRIKKRKLKQKKIAKSHVIKKQDALDFMKKEFNVNVGEMS